MPPGESYTDHTARYKSTISTARLTLQHLLSSTHSNQWKRINNNNNTNLASSSQSTSTNERLSTTASASENGVNGNIGQVEPSMIKLHKRPSINSPSSSSSSSTSSSSADIIRATVEIPLPSNISEQGSKDLLEAFKVALKTPQLRPTWNKLVEQSTDLEYLDPRTKVSKTDYRLGWPASPRDTILISRTYTTPTTLIDLSTSLPRFADEPAFLRPAPPYVRSTIGIYSWCFQILPGKKLRITLFWSWSFGGTLNSQPHLNHMTHLVASLVGFVRSGGSSRIPSLRGWIQPSETEEGGIELTVEGYDQSESKWNGEWNVVNPASRVGGEGKRERRLEVGLPVPAGSGNEGGKDGWDVRINVNSSSSREGSGGKPFEVRLIKSHEDGGVFSRLELVIVHPYAPPPPASNDSSISALEGFELGRVSVKCGIMRLVGGKGVRVNGELIAPMSETEDESEGAEGEVEEDGKKLNEVLKQLQKEEEEDTLEPADSLSLLSTSPRSLPTSINLLNSSSISLRSTNSASSKSRQTSHQISTLVRRSYIYFLSLLQEPPQKWRHISDSSSGVTVTQLLSPDPTLTIYRAEAVFVGVGVWDVFATISTMGVRKTWDRGLDEVKLIRQEGGNGNEGTGIGGELSEVWWEKRKANWPVAPRDSVTLRTSYKSPTSIHIFSSSTDDTSLFPHIPPLVPPTIRTQTDLSGWSIESLSPTTTSITLLDQSDPKGWSNKSSWTPNQLVIDVAGVRDFTIKNGAPPVVTRLNGAKKRELSYDHEKGVFRVEYEAEGMGYDRDLNEEGGSEVSSLFEGTSTPRGSIESTSTTSTRKPFNLNPTDHQQVQQQSHPIELELRCDVSVWSPQGLEIMIDPPPSSVSCLSRHRLSSTGGGLWLTIEHPLLIVESSDGKVAITVRKAPKGTNSAPGGVSINGAKVRVDVEVLEDEKVRELEGRKRRKVSPVPLDQYETLGARVWGNNGSAASSSGDIKKAVLNGASGEEKKSVGGDLQKKGAAVDGREEKSTAKGNKAPSIVSIDGSTSSIDPSPVTIDPSTTSQDPITPTSFAKPPLEPPAAALEALAYLQSFHAEQGPELTDPAPGWSIVSERAGTVVRKKMISRISDVFPVYRGDKIVQGLTADEIASVVTSPGCRKVWDERVDQAIPLASYGNGITTTAISTKPAFPFKGRIFYVSTVVASVKVPSASSTSSTSTVLFVASASYTPTPSSPPGPLDFDLLKANPNSLLSGQVLLEGWILETLDPYTSSVLAIPSTRCTYLANIDQKGSVPLALNQVLNANLAKSIGNVEAFGKTKGPLPRIWNPSNGVQIEGPLSEDGEGDCLWKLGRVGKSIGGGEAGESKVVTANYGDEENTFRALFKVGGKSQIVKEEEVTVEKVAESRKEQLIKKGSSNSTVTNKSLAVGPTLLKSELPRSASLNFGTVAPPVLHKPPITSELSHKRSRSSLRSKSPAAPPIASGAALASSSSPAVPATSSLISTSNDLSSNDLVVAELIVDLKQYPHGYSVLASSSLLTLSDQASSSDPLSIDPLPPRSLAPSSSLTPTLPLRLTAHDAPLPSILTASLDAWKRANHLVRILVPTSPITHPLQDPLREPSKTRLEKPEWYKILSDGAGALVEVRIVPLPAPNATLPNEKERPKLPQGAGSEPTGLGKVTGQANRTVMFNGEKVVVMSQKESRAVLSRFEDEDAPLQGAKISRVPRRKRKVSTAPADPDSMTVSSLPLELQRPLAVAVSLLAPKLSTPVVDDFEFPDPKSPGMMTPAQEKGGRSPVMSKSGSMQNASNRRGTNSSESTPLSGPLSAILGSYPLARLGSSIVNATTPAIHNPSSTGTTIGKRTYSLGFVFAVAMIAFLLGSFLRSLLTPADYIIYHPVSTPSVSDSVVEKAILTAIDPHRRWREARRLLELRTGFIGWDIIFAAVKRE